MIVRPTRSLLCTAEDHLGVPAAACKAMPTDENRHRRHFFFAKRPSSK
jgi:hypothetical protein